MEPTQCSRLHQQGNAFRCDSSVVLLSLRHRGERSCWAVSSNGLGTSPWFESRGNARRQRPLRVILDDVECRHRDCLRIFHPWWNRGGVRGARSLRAIVRVGVSRTARHLPSARLARSDCWLCLTGRPSRAVVAQCSGLVARGHPGPPRSDRLLVGDDVVLALWPEIVARSLPSTGRDRGLRVGMEIVFSIIFSETVISDDKKYGPIGVVFALMSWLIAIGVVIILGAVVGLVWREQHLAFSSAFRWLLRPSRRKGHRR